MSIEGFRNLNSDLETIINKSDAVKGMRKGKDDLTPKEKKDLSQEEKEIKSLRRQIQQKLIKFAARIPIFMYLSDFREYCLKDVITQLEPHLFRKVVLSSPMIRPLTGKVPFADAKRIAAFACATERGTQYVVGQKPYQGIESFKQSSSLSRPRFLYYQQKREKEPLYHLNAASYGWLHAAAHLYRDLMRSGWKRIEAPVLLFQAENDHLVSNRAQERMIRKMAERRPGMAKMVKVPGAKHELFGTRGRMLQTYWNMVFAFLEKDL